jgi:hypothetical protein
MLRFATLEFKGVVGFRRGPRSYHHAPPYIFASDKESECLVEGALLYLRIVLYIYAKYVYETSEEMYRVVRERLDRPRLGGLELVPRPAGCADADRYRLGCGRIAVSETRAPNLLANHNLVRSG